MLLQIGEQNILENILSGFKANNINLPKDEKELRFSYQEYLKVMQPHCTWLRSETCTPIENFTYSSGTRNDLFNLFCGDASALDDKDQTTAIKLGEVCGGHNEIVKSAISAMKRDTVDYYNFLNSFIEVIFYEGSDVSSGGSTSNAIGVIWANPHPKFSVNDVLEFLVHELTHNLLFLDEWVHPHYDYDIILKPETWCNSAILHIKRPLDKVVHSIIVATEIVLLRNKFIGEPQNPCAHPPSDTMITSILDSIAQIRQLSGAGEFIKPRVWHLLNNVESKLGLISSSIKPALVS